LLKPPNQTLLAFWLSTYTSPATDH